LYKEAAIDSENFLSRFGAKAESYLIVGEAMRRSKNEDQALFILEKGHLRYPANEKILLSLAHTYMQSEKNIAAARLFEKSAAFNPEYLQQAIGLYRMVGDTWRAKFLNAQVTDTKQKLKNWMEILLVEESYEEILAIEERLVRYGVLKDDKLMYAMAYVHFISENYDASESFLKGISDPQVFKSSIKLLKAIELVRSRREKT
jgi:tetratricopeptide (TPR) repeat protein